MRTRGGKSKAIFFEEVVIAKPKKKKKSEKKTNPTIVEEETEEEGDETTIIHVHIESGAQNEEDTTRSLKYLKLTAQSATVAISMPIKNPNDSKISKV